MEAWWLQDLFFRCSSAQMCLSFILGYKSIPADKRYASSTSSVSRYSRWDLWVEFFSFCRVHAIWACSVTAKHAAVACENLESFRIHEHFNVLQQKRTYFTVWIMWKPIHLSKYTTEYLLHPLQHCIQRSWHQLANFIHSLSIQTHQRSSLMSSEI